MRKRQRSERGVAAVEFALVLPILVVILFGTITGGIAYSNAIGVTNAVREGARFGATSDATQGSWEDDVIARTRESQLDDPDEESSVCVELVKIGTGSVKSECDGTPIDLSEYPDTPSGVKDTCVVKVVASREYVVNAIFQEFKDDTIRGSVARYERADTC